MKDLEEKLDKYMKARGWDKQIPADLAKSIMIEGAELLEHFQWENLSKEELKKDKKKLQDIQEELADVLIYSLELSVVLGFDTKKIILQKLAKAAKKYPAKLMQHENHQKLYLKIKKASRRKGL